MNGFRGDFADRVAGATSTKSASSVLQMRGIRIHCTPVPIRYSYRAILVWYILVQSIAAIWAHGSFQHYRVVKLAYELQNSCSIRLSQFSEFPQPVRIPYCRGARWLRMCQIASERGLDPFLSTSYRCLDGRFSRQIAHGRIRVYIGKGSKNSLTWKLQTPT